VRAITASSEFNGTDRGLDALDTVFQILALKLRERREREGRGAYIGSEGTI
jgi:hypothetical protein